MKCNFVIIESQKEIINDLISGSETNLYFKCIRILIVCLMPSWYCKYDLKTNFLHRGKVVMPLRISKPWLLLDWIYKLTETASAELDQKRKLDEFTQKVNLDCMFGCTELNFKIYNFQYLL